MCFGAWLGSDLLADVPEEVDERDGGPADDGRTAGDEDADLAASCQVRVGGVGAEAPHDRRDDEREDGQDQADGHDGTDDGAQLGDPGQAGVVGADVDVHWQHGGQLDEDGCEVDHDELPKDQNRPGRAAGEEHGRPAGAPSVPTAAESPPREMIRGGPKMISSELFAEVDEPVDPGDSGPGEDRGAQGDEDACAGFRGHVGVPGAAGDGPDAGGDDDHEDRDDQDDGEGGADDRLEVADAAQAVEVGEHVHHRAPSFTVMCRWS